MKLKLVSMSLVLSAMACGGGGDGSGGAGGNGGAGDSGDPPPNFTYEPEGDPKPPIVDEALANATVLETATLTATGGEDTLTLPGGFEMLVPAGALAAGETVVVKNIQFDDAPPGVTDAVYTFTASAQPSNAVTLTFPIPGDTANLTTHNVYVAWHHEQDMSITLDGNIDAVAKTIQVSTTSFSTGVVTNEGDIPEPPAAPNHIIKMPYYNQGSSGNCWSVAGSMLLSGYLNGDEIGRKLVKTWHLNEFFHLTAEHGYSFYPFIYGPDMRNFMTTKVPDAALERHVWFLLTSETKLKNYLIGNVLNDEPTMIYVKKPEAHMMLVVGYQQDGPLERFIIHDPANNAYVTMLWHELRDRFSVAGFDQAGTLSLGKPVAPVTSDATILVPFASQRSQGVDFIGVKKDGAFDVASASVFSWFVEARDSFGFVNTTTNAPASMKKDALMFMVAGVASNIHPDAEGGMDSKPYKVGFEVFDPSFAKVYESEKKSVSLKGGENKEVKLVEGAHGLKASTFAKIAGLYRINYFIEDSSGKRHDEAEISIDITDPCGDGVCSEDDGETETSCPQDCKKEECGDGVCTTGEECLIDCHCGNGQCETGFDENDPIQETMENCPKDCHCGDGVCDPETAENNLGNIFIYCDVDCHCGNGYCDKGLFGSSIPEDENNCPTDCATCTEQVCGYNVGLCCGSTCCPEFALGCDAEGKCVY